MTRSVMMSWRNYQPYGKEYYDPLWYGFLKNLKLWANEFDKLYILDSQWNFTQEDIHQLSLVKDNFEVIVTDPSLRYYNAYKKHLPEVKEDLVLFMDNDFVVYKEKVISGAFEKLEVCSLCGHNEECLNKDCGGCGYCHNPKEKLFKYDVISITDTIGTMKVPLKTGNKLCPYFFATRKELLMKYLDIDWSPDAMPYTETFGLLTEALLKDGARVYEIEDDKTDFPTKDLGFYHIRGGSTPAYLLAEKHYGNKETYFNYLKNQPRSEYLRQCEWYKRLGGDPSEIIEDSKDL